jgi:acyl-CoA thioester hydrolase
MTFPTRFPTPFPSPFPSGEGVVLPEWIDSNGHMNLAYYVVLFDQATDAVWDALGLGDGYRLSGHGTFAVEMHMLYAQELLVHERVRMISQILDVDSKRLHLAHEMRRLSDDAVACREEIMFLHVDLASRKVAPWPGWLQTRLDAASGAHAALPRPDWVGRSIRNPARASVA